MSGKLQSVTRIVLIRHEVVLSSWSSKVRDGHGSRKEQPK